MNSCSADKNTSEIIIHIRIAKKGQNFRQCYSLQTIRNMDLSQHLPSNKPFMSKMQCVTLLYMSMDIAIWILGYLEMFNILSISNRWSGDDEWKDNVANHYVGALYYPVIIIISC